VRSPVRAALAVAAGAWLALTGAACSHGARFQPYPEAEVAGHKDAHEFRGKPLCQACHVPGNGLKAEPVAVCGHCHDVRHMNHPMAVPMREQPEGLPLWNATIVCHTCHDPHDVKGNPAGLRYAGKDLCLRCHLRHRAPAHGGGSTPGG
jgi:predicted CXXCH cytochrome family protein